jgi:hypothetical protein
MIQQSTAKGRSSEEEERRKDDGDQISRRKAVRRQREGKTNKSAVGTESFREGDLLIRVGGEGEDCASQNGAHITNSLRVDV